MNQSSANQAISDKNLKSADVMHTTKEHTDIVKGKMKNNVDRIYIPTDSGTNMYDPNSQVITSRIKTDSNKNTRQINFYKLDHNIMEAATTNKYTALEKYVDSIGMSPRGKVATITFAGAKNIDYNHNEKNLVNDQTQVYSYWNNTNNYTADKSLAGTYKETTGAAGGQSIFDDNPKDYQQKKHNNIFAGIQDENRKITLENVKNLKY